MPIPILKVRKSPTLRPVYGRDRPWGNPGKRIKTDNRYDRRRNEKNFIHTGILSRPERSMG